MKIRNPEIIVNTDLGLFQCKEKLKLERQERNYENKDIGNREKCSEKDSYQ